MTVVRGDTRETNQRDLRNAGSEIQKRYPHDTRMRTNVNQGYSHETWGRNTQDILTGHRARETGSTRCLLWGLLKRSFKSSREILRRPFHNHTKGYSLDTQQSGLAKGQGKKKCLKNAQLAHTKIIHRKIIGGHSMEKSKQIHQRYTEQDQGDNCTQRLF